MKLLIVSDIHANLEALQAVLAESHDELWVLGDLVNYGPNPSEVVDLVCRYASVMVQGNHDYAVGGGSDPQGSSAFREMARAMQNYTEPLLNADQRALLRSLPRTAARTVDGYRFFLCHATPTEPLFQYFPAHPYGAPVQTLPRRARAVGVGDRGRTGGYCPHGASPFAIHDDRGKATNRKPGQRWPTETRRAHGLLCPLGRR